MRRKQKRTLFDPLEPSRAPKRKTQILSRRCIGVLVIFLAVIVFYLIKLGDIQKKGDMTNQINPDQVVRTYSVAGLRGEIYDRNGVLLVGNETRYDVIFEYGAIPDTTHEFNRSILEALDAIEITGNAACLCDDFYVLEGLYPKFSYSAKVSDPNSDESKYLKKILDSNNLPSDTSADELASALARKYRMYEDYYTTEEITDLLRVRYEMERVGFGYYQPYTLAKNVPVELISFIEEAGIDGINFKIEAGRVYSYPGYASHILGRVGKIQESELEYYEGLGYSMNALVGNSGCEKAFESYLHSQDGVLEVTYDKNGNIIDKKYLVEPISGNDVWLTIDINMQIAAEDSLKKSIDSLPSSNAGSAVAVDANSGAVLAIASYPTFDLTKISDPDYYDTIRNDKNSPEMNRALSGSYAPGSVYKLGVALAALEEKNIDFSTSYTCNKVFPHLHNPTCLENHGAYTVTEAIRDSCNVFFYYLGMDMGTDNITKYTLPLGLGAHTGIEIPENAGTVGGSANSSDPWSKGNDLSAAIGQANHAYTPLQMALYTATLTNGGNRYNAHLLDSVREFYTQRVIFDYEESVAQTISISPENRTIILNAMRDIVDSHSSIKQRFASLSVAVGGKTGTAEVNGKVDNALFAGVAPYDDPEIAAVCILEEGAVGANASATVAEIFKAYYNGKQITDAEG